MAKAGPFDEHHRRYEAWFDQHEAAFISEQLALRAFVPWQGLGVEIGSGSGRFAAPLSVQIGVDPSEVMLTYAAARGIVAVKGIAEHLPLASGRFDHALIMTTSCFLDSPAKMLAEANRVLKPQGRLVVGFIDRTSVIGEDYVAHQAENVFYRQAIFYSASEVKDLLLEAGFAIEAWGQTLAHPLTALRKIEPLRPGHGDGAFVVVAATAGN